MAVPSYQYSCIHGCDPWEPVEGKTFATNVGDTVVPADQAVFGGGGKVTGGNLVLGAWTIDTMDSEGQAASGVQLRPLSSFPDLNVLTTHDSIGMFSQFVDSRLSTRLALAPGSGADGFDASKGVLVVLNPPPGYKDYMRHALSGYTNESSANGVAKSLRDGAMWGLSMATAVGAALGQAESAEIRAGSPIGLVGSISQSILKTSGVDGEYPTFQPTPLPATPASFTAMQALLNSGDYFIPVELKWDSTVGSATFILVDIIWPASATR